VIIISNPFELQLAVTMSLSRLSAQDTFENPHWPMHLQTPENRLTTRNKPFFERTPSYQLTDSLANIHLYKSWLMYEDLRDFSDLMVLNTTIWNEGG
jgi:hypothetical protein